MLSSAWRASEATMPFYLFFSDIDMDFSFPPKVGDHNNEQLKLREVGKLLRGKENKGELFSVHPSFNS